MKKYCSFFSGWDLIGLNRELKESYRKSPENFDQLVKKLQTLKFQLDLVHLIYRIDVADTSRILYIHNYYREVLNLTHMYLDN